MDLSKLLERTFNNKNKYNWNFIYITVDIHGTIIKPTREKNINNIEFYPYALETLQLLSKCPDIKLIIWSSSYYDKLIEYKKIFNELNINFNFINNNKDVNNNDFADFSFKHYTDIGLDDKFGFEPNGDWKIIFDFIKHYYNY